MNNLDSELDVVGLDEGQMEEIGKIISRGPLLCVPKQKEGGAKTQQNILAGNQDGLVSFAPFSSSGPSECSQSISPFMARLRESVRAEAAAENDPMGIPVQQLCADAELADMDRHIEVPDEKTKKKSGAPLLPKSPNEEKGNWHWTRPAFPDDGKARTEEAKGANDIEEVEDTEDTEDTEEIEDTEDVGDAGGVAQNGEDAPCLPTIGMGPSDSILRVSAETLVEILAGRIRQNYVLLDCRFAHEYNGGHIVSATSVMTVQAVASLFEKHVQSLTPRPTAFIFYCEFSSVRAPRLATCMRNEDRRRCVYPFLLFPNVYVLDGGYRGFFRQYPDFCSPRSYVPMEP